MKITKTYLKQIIKEEFELLEAEKSDSEEILRRLARATREPSDEEKIAALKLKIRRLQDQGLDFMIPSVRDDLKILLDKQKVSKGKK